jgi:hypothetical protein
MAIKNPSRGSGGVVEESRKRDSKDADAQGGGAISGPGGENGRIRYSLLAIHTYAPVGAAGDANP